MKYPIAAECFSMAMNLLIWITAKNNRLGVLTGCLTQSSLLQYYNDTTSKLHVCASYRATFRPAITLFFFLSDVVNLRLVELVIDALLLHQIAVHALFDDATIFNHKNSIGSLNSRQAMSDHYARTAFSRTIQSLLNDLKRKDTTIVEINISNILDTFSLSVSRADVASSSRRTLGFLTRARAMAILCF